MSEERNPNRLWALRRLLEAAPVAGAVMLAVSAVAGTSGPLTIGNTTYTNSTTHETTVTNVTLPGSTVTVGPVVPGSGPLANQLQQILAGPNGATILNALNSVGNLGVLGPPGPSLFIGNTTVGTNTTVTTTETFGPRPYSTVTTRA